MATWWPTVHVFRSTTRLKAPTTGGSNCVPLQRSSSRQRLRRRRSRRGRRAARHRVVGVGDGDDPRAEASLVRRVRAVRIAAGHRPARARRGRCGRGGEERHVRNQRRARSAGAGGSGLLFDRQRRRLAQHRLGHRELAEVVQQRGALERRRRRPRRDRARAPTLAASAATRRRARRRRGSVDRQHRQQPVERVVGIDRQRARSTVVEVRRAARRISPSSRSRQRRESRADRCHSTPRDTASRSRSRSNGLVR